MPNRLKVRLEYRPCSCAAYVQPQVILRDAEGVLQSAPAQQIDLKVAHFDYPEIAAARVREIVTDEDKTSSVHHSGLHVSAAWIDGVRFPETGEI